MSDRERIAQDARLAPEVGTERRTEYRPAGRGEGDASGESHPPTHNLERSEDYTRHAGVDTPARIRKARRHEEHAECFREWGMGEA